MNLWVGWAILLVESSSAEAGWSMMVSLMSGASAEMVVRAEYLHVIFHPGFIYTVMVLGFQEHKTGSCKAS